MEHYILMSFISRWKSMSNVLVKAGIRQRQGILLACESEQITFFFFFFLFFFFCVAVIVTTHTYCSGVMCCASAAFCSQSYVKETLTDSKTKHSWEYQEIIFCETRFSYSKLAFLTRNSLFLLKTHYSKSRNSPFLLGRTPSHIGWIK